MQAILPIKNYNTNSSNGIDSLTILSFVVIIVTLTSAAISMRTNILQHKQISLQMKEAENLRKLKKEEESK